MEAEENLVAAAYSEVLNKACEVLKMTSGIIVPTEEEIVEFCMGMEDDLCGIFHAQEGEDEQRQDE